MDAMPRADPQGAFDACSALQRVGLLGACCAAQLVAVRVLGRGLPCPCLVMTGWLCPLCGCTRAGIELLHGHWLAAWQANWFALVLLAGLGACVACWSLEALGGPCVRAPRWVPPMTLDRVLLLVAGPALCWMLWRNLT